MCPAPVVYYSAPYCPPARVVYCYPSYCQPAGVVYYPSPCYLPMPYGPVTIRSYPMATPSAAEGTKPARAVTIKGKQYRIIPTADKGEHAKDEVEKAAELPSAKGTNIPASDVFRGTSRRIAKTTIFNGPVEDFDSVASLLDSLPKNQAMRDKHLSNAPTSNRVAEERKNVRVKAYIYAFKKEDDNDYHVILGDAPDAEDLRYLNAEVSGIPLAGTDANRAQLSAVRTAFKSTFGLGASGPGSYFKPDPPIPVRVGGSLFWDVDHEDPPYVGPQSHKPKTPWEIHPISEIEFLEE